MPEHSSEPVRNAAAARRSAVAAARSDQGGDETLAVAARDSAHRGIDLSPGMRQDPAALRLGVRVLNYAKAARRSLTLICGGYILRNDPNAAAGATFSAVRRRRPGEALILPRESESSAAFAVETVGPYDRHTDVADRVCELFDAGVARVWLIDPAHRSVSVHAPGRSVETLADDAEIDGGKELPEFRVRVGSVFAG